MKDGMSNAQLQRQIISYTITSDKALLLQISSQSKSHIFFHALCYALGQKV